IARLQPNGFVTGPVALGAAGRSGVASQTNHHAYYKKIARLAVRIGGPRKRARKASREVRDAASNRWLRLAERLGYVVRGLLYGTMGVLAFGLALGIGGQGTDQRGSLLVLGGLPLGAVFLALAVTGLAAYSLWGLIRALYDPLHAGSGPVGLAERAGFLWSGLTYGALAVFGVQVLSGHSGTGGSGL